MSILISMPRMFISALGRSRAEQGGGMLQAELPSFLVPFLAYFYYNLASQEVFPEEENVPDHMPKQAFSSPCDCVSHFDHIWVY